MNNKVKIIGFHQNPYKYIAKSNVVVLTSKYEGLPNVLLEALALKKLIVSSNCPTGPKEILNNGLYGYLFKIGNINQLKNIFLKIKFNNKEKKMIKNGFSSLGRFDFNKNNLAYFKVIMKYL